MAQVDVSCYHVSLMSKGHGTAQTTSIHSTLRSSMLPYHYTASVRLKLSLCVAYVYYLESRPPPR